MARGRPCEARVNGRLCGRLCVGVVAALTLLSLSLLSVRTPAYSDYLLRSLRGPIAPDDPEFLRYIRDEVLQQPSSKPYNLLGKSNLASLKVEKSEIFYNESLRSIFKDKTDGFFVEAGALDGESMSNTLWLEREQGWRGLLVEADAAAFLSLTSKHRRAWSANVCLAPFPYPSKEMFNQLPHYPGPLARPLGFKMRAMHGLVKYSSDNMLGSSWFQLVQCLPLQSLLLALKVTWVDLLVLDVEGAEMAILGHFDLKQFNVQVVCVEWKKMDELDSVSEKISEQGYEEVARTKEDLILVKRGSHLRSQA